MTGAGIACTLLISNGCYSLYIAELQKMTFVAGVKRPLKEI